MLVKYKTQQMEQKAIQRCNTDHFTGMKEETNFQNEPLSMKNETARLKQIITDCLICRISKILLQAYRQKSKAHSSQDGIVNLHFTVFLLSELSKKKKKKKSYLS